MDCEKVIEQLCEELADDVNGELCEELKEHIKHCDQCRQQLQSVKSTVELFRCLDQTEVPLSVHTRLLAMLNLTNATHKM